MPGIKYNDRKTIHNLFKNQTVLMQKEEEEEQRLGIELDKNAFHLRFCSSETMKKLTIEVQK